LFFGTEEDKNARFVTIDCGHTFEVKSLDKWMSLNTLSGSIKFKECPKCKQPIKKCPRY
jgi:hypothetical protein